MLREIGFRNIRQRDIVALDTVFERIMIISARAQKCAIPSPFVWNMDETRVACPKRIAQPEVIVAANTKPGSVTVPEEWGDA
jgi:hypothetical protein